MFIKKTIKDINLKGKTVLLRADYNVPTIHGKVTADYRVQKSIPTLQYLQEQECKVVIISHLGRPDGKPNLEYSLKPVAKCLSDLIKQEVLFADDCIGPTAIEAVKKLKPKQLLLLENLRFHPEEEANDAKFAKQLASLGEVFVQDGFGVVHRAHASTEAITKLLPSVAGLLLSSEVETLTNSMENPKRPLMTIIGGAKISDKIEFLRKFIELSDFVAVGGAMANTFLLAEGIDIGESKADVDDVPLAKEIIEQARAKAKKQQFIFYMPQDAVVASSVTSHAKTRIVDWSAHVIAQIESYPHRPSSQSGKVQKTERILDIGPFSASFIAGGMQLAKTVIWNGTLGITEIPSLDDPVGPFAHGTELIIEALSGEFGHKPYSLVGGGDTVGYLENRKLTDYFDHVSTGGGASLELMAGKKLPGVEALMDRE